MRHDPASVAIIIILRSLKMYGMAQAVTDLTGCCQTDANSSRFPYNSNLLGGEETGHSARAAARLVLKFSRL
jgi:hypothetical protein